MIRIKDVILNEGAIEFICAEEHQGLSAMMRSGREVSIPYAAMDDAHKALAEVGFIEPLPAEPEPIKFTKQEIEQLRLVFLGGMRYAAKDEDGKTYAYQMPPLKGTHSWINDDDNSGVGRLRGSYAALSFEDECPLDLSVILGEAAPC